MGDWEALAIQKNKPSKPVASADSLLHRSVGSDQQLTTAISPTVQQDVSMASSKPRCAGKEPFDIKTLYSQLGPKEPKPPEQHLCDICGREFNNKHAMNMHHWWHKKPTNECDRCGKQFSQPKRLLMHIQVHHNEAGSSARPYRCQHCGKHFVAKGFLANHIAKKHKDVAIEGVNDDVTLRQDISGLVLLYFDAIECLCEPVVQLFCVIVF
jgi:DNA-directed RNA polymerase subunit RPC12/RpoP